MPPVEFSTAIVQSHCDCGWTSAEYDLIADEHCLEDALHAVRLHRTYDCHKRCTCAYGDHPTVPEVVTPDCPVHGQWVRVVSNLDIRP